MAIAVYKMSYKPIAYWDLWKQKLESVYFSSKLRQLAQNLLELDCIGLWSTRLIVKGKATPKPTKITR